MTTTAGQKHFKEVVLDRWAARDLAREPEWGEILNAAAIVHEHQLATYRAALELALPVLEMVVGTADPDDALDWTHMAAAAVRAALARP